MKSLCTGRADGGREIDRSEYAQAVEENATRYKNNKDLYRKRQEINEHIFGTIKQKWSYYYADLRGLEKVNGEHSFICFVYNFVKVIKIESVTSLLEKIKKWEPNYRAIVRLIKITFNSDRIRAIKFGFREINSYKIPHFQSLKTA